MHHPPIKTRGKLTNTEDSLNSNLPNVAIRIEKAMQHWTKNNGQKLTWNGLTKALKLSAGAPNNWKKGKISSDTLEDIATFTGVNKTWLATGDGDMILGVEGVSSSTIEALAHVKAANTLNSIFESLHDIPNDQYRDSLEEDQEAREEYGREFAEEIAETNINNDEYQKFIQNVKRVAKEKLEEIYDQNVKEDNQKGVTLVPVISLVQAGNFREAILNAQDEFVACYAGNLGKDSFALRVSGTSMSPDFNQDDKIVCDPNLQPSPGDFVIAQNGNNEATFKKYKPRGFDISGNEFFELVPLNPDFPTMDSRYQDIKIIAVVVEHIRSLKR